jgi:hypothetical protein
MFLTIGKRRFPLLSIFDPFFFAPAPFADYLPIIALKALFLATEEISGLDPFDQVRQNIVR